MKTTEEIVKDIMTKRSEAIDVFFKFFIATEIKDIGQLKGSDLVLVETQVSENPFKRTYHIEFKPLPHEN